MLDEGAFTGTGYAAQNAGSQRYALAHGLGGGSGFGLDLDFLGSVVEQADTDVFETEILLNFRDDLGQHVHGIIAGDGGAGNVVEKGELAGAVLLVGKQAGVLHGNGNLSGSRGEDIEIALFEDKFALGMHRDHDSGGLVAHENGYGDKALGGAAGTGANA